MKQKSWGTDKVWWMPVLVRGKLHTVVLPESFQEETAEYIDIAIGKIRGILNVRFPQDNKPKLIMSDRGVPLFTFPHPVVSPTSTRPVFVSTACVP